MVCLKRYFSAGMFILLLVGLPNLVQAESPKAAWEKWVRACNEKDWGKVYEGLETESKVRIVSSLKVGVIMVQVVAALQEHADEEVQKWAKIGELPGGKEFFTKVMAQKVIHRAELYNKFAIPDHKVVRVKENGRLAIILLQNKKGEEREITMIKECQSWKVQWEIQWPWEEI